MQNYVTDLNSNEASNKIGRFSAIVDNAPLANSGFFFDYSSSTYRRLQLFDRVDMNGSHSLFIRRLEVDDNNSWYPWTQLYPDYSNQLFTEHGYIVYVNGLIVQWSYEVISSASPSIAYYPIAFTNTCRNVQLTSLKANESDTSAHMRCGCVYTYNPTFITAQSNQSGYFMWHAVGY